MWGFDQENSGGYRTNQFRGIFYMILVDAGWWLSNVPYWIVTLPRQKIINHLRFEPDRSELLQAADESHFWVDQMVILIFFVYPVNTPRFKCGVLGATLKFKGYLSMQSWGKGMPYAIWLTVNVSWDRILNQQHGECGDNVRYMASRMEDMMMNHWIFG